MLCCCRDAALLAIAVAREYELEADLSAEITAFGASAALVTVPLWGNALEYLS